MKTAEAIAQISLLIPDDVIRRMQMDSHRTMIRIPIGRGSVTIEAGISMCRKQWLTAALRSGDCDQVKIVGPWDRSPSHGWIRDRARTFRVLKDGTLNLDKIRSAIREAIDRARAVYAEHEEQQDAARRVELEFDRLRRIAELPEPQRGFTFEAGGVCITRRNVTPEKAVRILEILNDE